MSRAALGSVLLTAMVFTLGCEDRTPVAPSPSPAAGVPSAARGVYPDRYGI